MTETTPTLAAPRPRSMPRGHGLRDLGILAIILLLGGALRFTGLYTWDAPSTGQHPDERFMMDVASQIELPASFGEYIDSYANPLNPRNNGKDFYVYGLFPQVLTRYTAVMLSPADLSRDDPNDPGDLRIPVFSPAERAVPRIPALIALLNPEGKNLAAYGENYRVGRTWSALFDMGTTILVFLLGSMLYSRRVGLTGAALYTMSVMPIQIAHFFTVDSITGFFVLATIIWGARIAKGGGILSYTMLGVCIGMAAASRITLATLGLVGMIATTVVIWQRWRARSAPVHGASDHEGSPLHLARATTTGRPSSLVNPLLLLVLAGMVTAGTFRLMSPDSFIGSRAGSPPVAGTPAALDNVLRGAGLFDIRLEPRFLGNMSQISKFASGEIDWPPTNQWASRPRYLFALDNMIVWGMGVPLGIAAWAGWLVAGYTLIRRRNLAHIVPWAWVTFFFGWQGGQFLMSMRYYALIYGMLALFAAWLLWAVYDVVRQRVAGPQAQRWWRLAAVPLVFVMLGTASWAHAFTRIYTEPHARVQAARWIYANIPPGSTVSSEAWDDGLPMSLDGRGNGEYRTIQLHPYAEDDLNKYTGYIKEDGTYNEGLLDSLDQLDYLIISSNRVFDSVTRLAPRYPAITRFYDALFREQLGFELVADFRSYPTLFGVPINDQGAEEAFHVYDHPRVLIFKKITGANERERPAYSRELAEAQIIQDVAWNEVYKLPTVKISQVPTALRLTDVQWPAYREAGTWTERFDAGPIITAVPWLWWLLAVELLALAVWPILFRVLPHLPDRGFSLAKTIGLLLAAYLVWLGGSLGARDDGVPLLPFGNPAVRGVALALLALGGLLALAQRDDLAAFARRRRTALLTGQGLFLGVFLLFVLFRAFNPDLWHPARGGEKPMDLAYLTAVMKSPAFPPYDPWFAGGYLNYYYFGFVLVSIPALLIGLAPAVAYNLAVPTIAALTALGAWGVAYNLLAPRLPRRAQWQGWWPGVLRRRREGRALLAGVMALLFVVFSGNLAQALWQLPGTAERNTDFSPECQAAISYAAQQVCKGRIDWAFWDATRLVAMATGGGEISEFPFFTFLFADLHAHMIAMPLALAALGFGVAAARTRMRAIWRLVPWFALLTGALYATNTWDYPVALVLALAALAVPAWRALRRGAAATPVVLGWLAAAGATLVLGTLLFAPFRSSFATDYAGFLPWTGERTPAAQALLVYGLWIFLGVSGGLWLYVRSGRVPVRAALAIGGVLLLAALGSLALGLGALLLFLALALLATFMLADLVTRPGVRGAAAPTTVLAVGWAAAAIGIPFVTELIVAKGDIGRLNTVFKLGLASWLLCGVVGGIVFAQLWHARRMRIWRVPATLLVAASLVYPLTATPVRLADRFDATIAPTLDGTAFLTSEQARWSENGIDFTFAEDAQAIDWLRANVRGTPILLEAHAEAYRWAGRYAIQTGLPTLIGWPWHQTQQRSVANVDPILASRQQLVRDLYTTLPADEILPSLQLYGVEYVVVGRLETAQYGPLAAVRFAELARQNQISELFRTGETAIYQIPRGDRAPGVLTLDLPIVHPANAPAPASMLPIRVGQLSALSTPGWNTLAANPLVAIAIWLLVWYILGLLGLPLAALVFPRARDAGWGAARVLALLVLGYLVWLPVSGRILQYDSGGVLWGLAGAVGVAALALTQLRGDDGSVGIAALRARLRASRAGMITSEAIFLVGFAVMVAIRMLNPDLWHPSWGGEKPFEFGFFNAVLRSPVMPPYNPFYSDGTINYYYYGFFLVSLPVKLTGIAPAIAYNLIVPTLFGLTATGVYTLARRLSGRIWAAAVTVALAMLAGNPAALLGGGWSRGAGAALEALREGLPGAGERLGDWFIGPTRVIERTINEFPYFTFLFADMHPHMIALAPALLLLALAYAMFAERDVPAATRWARRVVAALVLGALAVTNSWDFPTYGAVLGLALMGAAWRADGRDTWLRAGRAALAGLGAVAIGGAGLLAYLSFFQNYVPQVGGVATVTVPSDLGEYLLVNGLFAALLVPALFVMVWQVLAALERVRRDAPAFGAVARGVPGSPVAALRALVLAAVVLVALAPLVQLLVVAAQSQPGIAAALDPLGRALSVRVWIGALLLVGALLLTTRLIGTGSWFGVSLAVAGFGATLIPELVYIRDHLDGGEWYRMNTMFKFGLQGWLLLAIASGALLPRIVRGLRRAGPLALGAGSVGLALVAVVGAAYPIIGTPSRVGLRFGENSGPVTLDGLAFLRSSSYTLPDYATQGGETVVELRYDAAAIDWLLANVRGTPVVAQSSLEFYRAYGTRVAANTGFPTIVSPLHESEQRDGVLVGAREADSNELFRTTDLQRAVQILAKYQVGYVYVGPVERAAYGAAGAAKFDALVDRDLDVAYSNEQVTIYRVRDEARARSPFDAVQPADEPAQAFPTLDEPPPQQNTGDPDAIAAAEARVAAAPGNAGAAFGLAELYRAIGRFDEAADVLALAAGANPTDIGLHHLWGDILLDAQRYDEAEIAYGRAIAAQPNAGNYNKLANGQVVAGRLEAAEVTFKLAIATDATATDPHFFLGQLYEDQNRIDEAAAAYQQYLAIAPADAPYRAQAAEALARMGR